ncbi:CvpA family protein [Sandaracinobacteroides hominis]|uniref:CvpA family protein n=1 Tax=Sandaracinobacteroides hominis TaxID=2780086 RepID=UPI0018F4F84E|nr:CvpA family protein [Sandaracinobacteroides hominis]
MDIFETFTTFDWVVVTMIGLMAVAGLVRGFTQEALSLAGWIAAILVVRFFHEDVTMWLTPRVGGEASGAIVGFLLLFFGTVIAARLLAGAAGGFAKRSLLGPMDRVLGLGFGALKGLILASVLFLLTQFATGLFDPDKKPPEWLTHSRSAPLLALAANAMVGWVHDLQAEDGPQEGALGFPPGVIPPGMIPPGAMPPGHPPVPPGVGRPEGDGYSVEDREALDKLLEDGAKAGEEVSI